MINDEIMFDHNNKIMCGWLKKQNRVGPAKFV